MFGMYNKEHKRFLFIVSKIALSDLIGKPLSSLVTNFEQIMKSFLV